jgi:hypothetical protein
MLVAGDTVEFQKAFVLPLCGRMEMNLYLSGTGKGIPSPDSRMQALNIS